MCVCAYECVRLCVRVGVALCGSVGLCGPVGASVGPWCHSCKAMVCILMQTCVRLAVWLCGPFGAESSFPFTHTHVHKHTHRHTDIDTHTRTHRHTLAHTHTQTHTHTHTQTYTHRYTHTDTQTHRHTHTDTDTDTHTHTRAWCHSWVAMYCIGSKQMCAWLRGSVASLGGNGLHWRQTGLRLAAWLCGLACSVAPLVSSPVQFPFHIHTQTDTQIH